MSIRDRSRSERFQFKRLDEMLNAVRDNLSASEYVTFLELVIAQMNAGMNQILDLHKPTSNGPANELRCRECQDSAWFAGEDVWPCDTVRLLTGETA